MPTQTSIRRVYKPIVFVLCLLPLASLAWRGFGLRGSSLGADPVAEVLHTLGDWGLKFLLLTLLITPLRTLLKTPWLIGFRRMLGLYAFFYVLLHFLTWLVLDRGLFWPGILEDIGKRPFITIGFAAFVLLIPLAVTSTNAMMRRLGRRWQRLHRLIYVIAILAVWHYYWLVKADVREPLVYAGVVALLFGWRVWHARVKKIRARTATQSVS